MNRQAVIERTLNAINHLPDEKAQEVSDFADYLTKRYEEDQLNRGIAQLASDSTAFQFLHQEEEIYTEKDLKEVYNA